jgi:hypothetical protein
MSDDDQYRSRNSVPSQADLTMNGDAAADATRVGYRRPPRHSRFQRGQSGNPRGRQKGVKSLPDIVRKIVGQKVTVTENGRGRRIPDWRRSSCGLPARRRAATRGPCACCYN